MANFKADVKLGVNWVLAAVQLLKARPNKWLFFALMYVMLFAILPSIIQPISYVSTVIWPIFIAAAMAMLRNVDEQQTQEVREIVQGLKPKMRPLMILGAVSLLYVVLIMLLLNTDIQGLIKLAPQGAATMTEAQAEAIVDQMLPLLLKLSLLMLPLFMATWFAPMLIAFNQYSVAKAIKSSIAGSLQYTVALGVAWLTLTAAMAALLVLVGIVFGLLGQLIPSAGLALSGPVILLCMLVAVGMMLAVQYLSYRDVFRAAPTY